MSEDRKQLRRLARRFPDKLVDRKGQFDYVEHAVITQVLLALLQLLDASLCVGEQSVALIKISMCCVLDFLDQNDQGLVPWERQLRNRCTTHERGEICTLCERASNSFVQ